MNGFPIHVTNLHKTFPMGLHLVNALRGVDLDIPANSFVAILGPSGSGKSTLLHLLGGLDRPTRGSIQINGSRLEEMDENAMAAYRRNSVGFVFQSFNLIPSMTALENVAFPLRFCAVPRKARLHRAVEMLNQVGLGERVQHRPSELSGGQQQRAAIARALINQPQLILADEPTGNLDTQSGMQILQLLADLHRQGRTVLVVSHDPRATTFATHTMYLLDGCNVEQDEYNKALVTAQTENSSQ